MAYRKKDDLKNVCGITSTTVNKEFIEELIEPVNKLVYGEDYTDEFEGESVLVEKIDVFDISEEEIVEVDLQFNLDKEQKENKYNLSKAELRQLKRTGLL